MSVIVTKNVHKNAFLSPFSYLASPRNKTLHDRDPEKVLYLVEPRGFCKGVDRAIKTVEECLRVYGAPVYVKHEIVHNEAVCNRLREKGAIFIEDLNLVPEGAVLVFSAHGVSPEVKNLAQSRKLLTIDATCPLVNKVHVYVSNKAKEGYKIILIGHKNHVETIGTFGEAPESCTIVETAADVETLNFDPDEKLFYVTQTTLSVDDCKDIVTALKSRFPNIESIPSGSICYATTNRQGAVSQICPSVELVLIVGSTQSSNANRLVEVALKRNTRALLISGPEMVDDKVLDGAKNIAISASASTPPDVTMSVVNKLASDPFNFKIENFTAMQERVPNWRLPRYVY
ncbi:4-hydroxy-3-methylbut-2-enyl diphosphate reductase [Babesia duncani]|uniref:4-hydroxy-3-methylbut-2-enyl diphosphate reductase n=1 Tax=Babesia duncani TaxID=323732 RepID=A0AAD9UNL9_9APIC|nr:4-hydroxy-3-methylbut-2-enyl diphosphate reductase [Babesia duncani]